MQACGVSLFRLLRPIALLAVAGARRDRLRDDRRLPTPTRPSARSPSTSIASRAESDVKPRVFFEDFPNRVLYVRDMPAGRRLARRVPRRRHAAGSDDGLLREARAGCVIDRAKQTVRAGARRRHAPHDLSPTRPDDYDGSSFETLGHRHRPEHRVPADAGPLKGDNEMTIAELRARSPRRRKRGTARRTRSASRFSRSSRCRRPVSSSR